MKKTTKQKVKKTTKDKQTKKTVKPSKGKKTVAGETKILSVSNVPVSIHKKLEVKAKKSGIKKAELVRDILKKNLK